MFVLGYNLFCDEEIMFDSIIAIDYFFRIEMSNVITDHITIDNSLDVDINPNKNTWGYDTHILSKFQNDLEAGNIDIEGLEIDYVKLKRRKKGEFQWQDYIQWEYDVEKRVYTYMDRYVGSEEIYQYATIPVAVGGVEGKTNSDEIKVHFDNYFIMDKYNTYKITFNANYSNMTKNKPSSTFALFFK